MPPTRRRRGRPDGRQLTVKVRTARGRTTSSTRWLQRQLNDPYVAEAQRRGYRSRAAFKLINLDDKFHFLAPGKIVVDLGAAPGGWTQVSVERVDPAGATKGRVLATDIVEIEPVPDAETVTLDLLDPDAAEELIRLAGSDVDVVLSDMSPATTGHRKTDQVRSVLLCETAFDIARDILAQGGTLVMKVFEGGAHHDLMMALKRDFAQVRHFKPEASRSDSPEIYLVATGFRGVAAEASDQRDEE